MSKIQIRAVIQARTKEEAITKFFEGRPKVSFDDIVDIIWDGYYWSFNYIINSVDDYSNIPSMSIDNMLAKGASEDE